MLTLTQRGLDVDAKLIEKDMGDVERSARPSTDVEPSQAEV